MLSAPRPTAAAGTTGPSRALHLDVLGSPDERVGSRQEVADAPVVGPADDVRWLPPFPSDLEDLGFPIGLPDLVAPDDEVVARACVQLIHGAFLAVHH